MERKIIETEILIEQIEYIMYHRNVLIKEDALGYVKRLSDLLELLRDHKIDNPSIISKAITLIKKTSIDHKLKEGDNN